MMKLKKRKIKYSAIFLLCWFALLVLLVDGVLKFQTLVGGVPAKMIKELRFPTPGFPDECCYGMCDSTQMEILTHHNQQYGRKDKHDSNGESESE